MPEALNVALREEAERLGIELSALARNLIAAGLASPALRAAKTSARAETDREEIIVENYHHSGKSSAIAAVETDAPGELTIDPNPDFGA